MRIAFIGTVEFSKKALLKLISMHENVVGVVSMANPTFNADFADLSDVCRKKQIPYKKIIDINSEENIEWIKGLSPDIIFCFGFSQLLKKELLNLAPMGVLGFHPAMLPQNRGRHPLIWALVLGLTKTASTFFFMTKGTDDGDILSQVEVGIIYQDNARTLYDKVCEIALKQIEDFIPSLKNNTFNKIKQDNSLANYWRKRDVNDGKIDFKMDSRAIYNLVRALAKPYVGAHLCYRKKQIKVWEAQEENCNLQNIEHGKVLSVKNKRILIKCYTNAIWLNKHEFKDLPDIGEYLYE